MCEHKNNVFIVYFCVKRQEAKITTTGTSYRGWCTIKQHTIAVPFFENRMQEWWLIMWQQKETTF